jgi:hypothetical protein
MGVATKLSDFYVVALAAHFEHDLISVYSLVEDHKDAVSRARLWSPLVAIGESPPLRVVLRSG